VTNLIQKPLALLAVLFAAVALLACGGSSGQGAKAGQATDASSDAPIAPGVVARVGGKSITQAEVNGLLHTVIVGDFFANVRARAPEGLVAEPEDPQACVAAMKGLLSEAPPKAQPTVARLTARCHQLHEAVKLEAVQRLVSTQWLIGQAAEQGLSVSDAEVARVFHKLQAKEFPTTAQLDRFLATAGRSLATELTYVKRDLLSQKLKAKLFARGNEASVVKYANDVTSKWTARTTCRPGYVVSECKQYVAATDAIAEAESPAVILEELTKYRKQPKKAPDILCNNKPGGGTKCRPFSGKLGKPLPKHKG
jgi:hypothetical protein